MNLKISTTFAILFACTSFLALQGQVFQNYYEFSNTGSSIVLPAIGYDVIQTSDPKYLLMGGALRQNDGEMLLVNMKGNGQISNWEYKYEATTYSDGGSISGITEVGGTQPGYVVVGTANERPIGSFSTILNRMVLKVDLNGNPLWGFTGQNNFMIDVADDPNSNTLFALGMTGWCPSGGSACYNSTYIAAFNKNTGALLWDQVYRSDVTSTNTESPTGIIVDSNGNVIVCANAIDASGIRRIVIFKTDPNGVLLLNKSYYYPVGNVDLTAKALALKPNGNYLVVSKAKQNVLNRTYVHAMEIDPNTGNILPNRSVLVKDANVDFYPEDVKVESGGQSIIVGSGNQKRGLYVRLSGALNLAKVRIYSNTLLPGTNRFTAVDFTSDTSLAITGRVDGNFWFVRAKKSGTAICEYDINKTPVQIPLTESVQGVAGTPFLSMAADSFTVTSLTWQKYDECAASSSKLSSHIVAEKPPALSIYPNPSAGNIVVEMNGFEGPSQLRILNNQGIQVHKQEINDRQHKLNLSHLSKGLYFIEVQHGQASPLCQKLILQ